MNEVCTEVTDSHCHLDFKNFDKDREEVMQRARDLGVTIMINSGIDYSTNRKSLALAKKYDFIYATLGFNPNSVEGMSTTDIQAVLNQIKENAGEAVGIGEAGLDYCRCKNAADREKQAQVFSQVIELAGSLDMPLVIHSRDAEQKSLEMVSGLKKVVFHCYGGSLPTMKQAVDMGFYISLATVICKSVSHQILARNIPLDHLLVETDSPFLSPRHGRNEPSNVLDSVKLIARIRGVEPSVIAQATRENARRVFSLP